MSTTNEAVIGANIGVGTSPQGVYVDSNYAWVANSGSNTVSQILADFISTEYYYYYSSTNPIVTIDVGTSPVALVSDGTYCWVANSGSNSVSQIEISTSSVINTITVGSNPQGIATNSNYVFVSNYNDNTVSKIDKKNSPPNVVQTITGFKGPLGIVANGDYFFVANSTSNNITQCYLSSAANSATTESLLSITVGTGPTGVSLDSKYIWVSCPTVENTIYRINQNNDYSVSKISIGTTSSPQYANAISSDGTYVWITNTSTSSSNGTVLQLQISSSSIINTFPYTNFFNDSNGISSNGSYCWATSSEIGSATQIDILTNYQPLVLSGVPISIEPSLEFPYSMAVNPAGTYVFITATESSDNRNFLIVVNTQTLEIVGNPIGIYSNGIIISADNNYCWVPATDNDLIIIVSIDIIVVAGSVVLPTGSGPIAVSSDGTYCWVANNNGSISVIDANSTELITTFSLQSGSVPSNIVSDGTNVWVVDSTGGNVAVFPVTIVNSIENITYISIPNSNNLQGIASDTNYIWVTDINDSSVYQIDKSSQTVIAQIAVESKPYFCVSNGTTLWVSCSVGSANDNGPKGAVNAIDIASSVISQTISTNTPAAVNNGYPGFLDCYGIIYFTNPYSSSNPQVWVVDEGLVDVNTESTGGIYLSIYNVS